MFVNYIYFILSFYHLMSISSLLSPLGLGLGALLLNLGLRAGGGVGHYGGLRGWRWSRWLGLAAAHFGDDNLGQVPVHFSRFHPSYKMMDAPITSEKILENAARIAEKKGLDYVYVGNIRHEKENTHCHNCGHLVIERSGYVIKNTDLNKKGKTCHCPACSEKIPLAGMQWSGII